MQNIISKSEKIFNRFNNLNTGYLLSTCVFRFYYRETLLYNWFNCLRNYHNRSLKSKIQHVEHYCFGIDYMVTYYTFYINPNICRNLFNKFKIDRTIIICRKWRSEVSVTDRPTIIIEMLCLQFLYVKPWN